MAGFYYGWQMALLILGIMPFLIVAAWIQTKFTAGAHNQVGSLAGAKSCCWPCADPAHIHKPTTSFIHFVRVDITQSADQTNI